MSLEVTRYVIVLSARPHVVGYANREGLFTKDFHRAKIYTSEQAVNNALRQADFFPWDAHAFPVKVTMEEPFKWNSASTS